MQILKSTMPSLPNADLREQTEVEQDAGEIGQQQLLPMNRIAPEIEVTQSKVERSSFNPGTTLKQKSPKAKQGNKGAAVSKKSQFVSGFKKELTDRSKSVQPHLEQAQTPKILHKQEPSSNQAVERSHLHPPTSDTKQPSFSPIESQRSFPYHKASVPTHLYSMASNSMNSQNYNPHRTVEFKTLSRVPSNQPDPGLKVKFKDFNLLSLH